MSKLLKKCLTHILSSDAIYSLPKSPPGKHKRLSLSVLLLLKAYNDILAHTKEKYPASGKHLKSAKNKQTAELKGPFTSERLRGTTKRRYYHAVDAVFLFVAVFIDKNLGFVESCDLTRMNVLYTKIAIKMLFEHGVGRE